MIGYLHGKLVEKKPPGLVVDVNGIGYEVEAPMSTFDQLPAMGEVTTLYTHLVVKEDSHQLFGFSEVHQRRLFRALIRVSGVGAKMAIGILSSIEPNHFNSCIQQGDTQALTRLPGIGRKTADRLIIEMRDHLKDWSIAPTHSSEGEGPTEGMSNLTAQDEAYEALVALGYKPQEAKRLVAQAVKISDTEDAEALIRQALKGKR